MKSGVLLTILGKVNRKVVERLTGKPVTEKNNPWFFADYANEEVAAGTLFDTLLGGMEKALIPSTNKVKLEKVYDQLGNRLTAVPEGFQTIVKLGFDNDSLPSVFNRLPSFDTWTYNPNPVSIAQHELVRLTMPDIIFQKGAELILIELKKAFADKQSGIPKKELVSYITATYHLDTMSMSALVNNLKLLGHMREKNDELELVA